MWQSLSSRTRKGFTLVELAVVIVIIGVLAAFGVPRFLKSVERTKASEAFAYLAAVRSAQERYIAKEGIYADAVSNLDIVQATPKNFVVGDVTASSANGGAPTWTLTLTRNSATSSYGMYTVIFTQDGFKSGSTILTSTASDISPLGSGI
jgi:prepilin-type N-terminal cleavage/methylation domain-containing protein